MRVWLSSVLWLVWVGCGPIHVHVLGRYASDSQVPVEQDVLGGVVGSIGDGGVVSGGPVEVGRDGTIDSGSLSSGDDSGYYRPGWFEILVGSGLVLAGARAISMYYRRQKK